MLPKNKRLNLKTHFRWVASGKSLSHPLFKLFYRFGDNPDPRIGVSLVSAQFKQSTQRSQAKRICFRIAAGLYSQLPKNLNLVIMPKAQILDTDSRLLSKELTNAIFNL